MGVNRIGKDGSTFFSKQYWMSFLRSFLPDAAANIIAVLLAIGAGWLFVKQTYDREREAAAAELSVEYAYFSKIGSVEKEPISELIYKIAEFEQYRQFTMKNMGQHDLRQIDAMTDEIGAGDAERLSITASMYKDFLSEKKNEISQQISAIPTMSKSELRMQGRATLESISGLDEDGIRAKLAGQLRKNKEEIDHLFVVLESLRRLLSRVDNRVFVKLSILNTGGRPGLVRPRGYIEYQDACYFMVRADAPPKNEQPIAVPTYVVNSDTGAVTQTVGKIDSDTMAQYWFEVLARVDKVKSCKGLPENLGKEKFANDRQIKICAERETALAYLFYTDNQPNGAERVVIPDKVNCDGPIL